MMPWRVCQRVCSSSAPYPLQNNPRSWAWKAFITQMPFAGVTFCPWYGREGQNEGTMVNHLQIMHYRLGLVCNQCLHFPSVTSETIWQHSWDCHQPKGSDVKEEDRGPMMCPHPTNLPQMSHLAWHYLPKAAVMQALPDNHTAGHSYFFRIHTILHCYLYHSLQMHLLL